ncbi:MAG: Vitamin epoxide reductase [Bacteroidetes bacterium]|nr:Vitamin epoxide reductase [Bacteroidota bacterium]
MHLTQWFRQRSQSDNSFAAVVNLLHLLDVRVTLTSIEKALKTNYTYPSIAAISESLEEWNIQSMVVKIPVEKLAEVDFPCIAHLHKNNGHFVVLTEFSNDIVTYTDPGQGVVKETAEDFAASWNGILLLVNADASSGEKGYAFKRRKEKTEKARLPLTLTIILLLVLSTLLLANDSIMHTPAGLFLFLIKCAGLLLSALLLLHYFADDNPFMQRICPTGRMLNCKGVLHSPAAKFLNIPMADLGALYFSGGALTLLFCTFSTVSPGVFFLFAVINLLTLPYTLFSLFYQAFVIKQWCWMCVGIQALFWIEFFVFLLNGCHYPTEIRIVEFLPFCWGFLLPLAIWIMVRPLIDETIKIKPLTQQLFRLKNNPYLFWTALTKQPKVNTDLKIPEEISRGPENATVTIIMITHPQCPQCQKVHHFLKELNEQFPGSFRYVIRFHCPVEDQGKEIARGIISCALKGDNAKAIRALEAGYNARTKKEFSDWKKTFYIEDAETVKRVELILEAHLEWSKEMNIKGTPSFYVNGHPLPAEFTIYDIKALLRLKKIS